MHSLLSLLFEVGVFGLTTLILMGGSGNSPFSIDVVIPYSIVFSLIGVFTSLVVASESVDKWFSTELWLDSTPICVGASTVMSGLAFLVFDSTNYYIYVLGLMLYYLVEFFMFRVLQKYRVLSNRDSRFGSIEKEVNTVISRYSDYKAFIQAISEISRRCWYFYLKVDTPSKFPTTDDFLKGEGIPVAVGGLYSALTGTKPARVVTEKEYMTREKLEGYLKWSDNIETIYSYWLNAWEHQGCCDTFKEIGYIFKMLDGKEDTLRDEVFTITHFLDTLFKSGDKSDYTDKALSIFVKRISKQLDTIEELKSLDIKASYELIKRKYGEE